MINFPGDLLSGQFGSYLESFGDDHSIILSPAHLCLHICCFFGNSGNAKSLRIPAYEKPYQKDEYETYHVRI